MRTTNAYTFEPALQDRGATIVEYALLVVLVAVICIAAITALGIAAPETISNLNQPG